MCALLAAQDPPRRRNRRIAVRPPIRPKTDKTTKFSNWRTLTLNINTCSDKYDDRLDDICQVGNQRKISVMVLTEFRRRGLDSREVKREGGTWDVYWTGLKAQRAHGVAVCLKREPKTVFLGRSPADLSNERMMYIDLQHCGFNIRIFAIYSPTDCGSDSAKEKFWRNLKKLTADIPANYQSLYLGDFNATTSLVRHMEPTYFGKDRVYDLDFDYNDNGERLTTFCAEKQLGMLNS